MSDQLRPGNPWLDPLLALASLATCGAEVLSNGHHGHQAHAVVLYSLVVVLAVPLAARRRWPLAVACMSISALVVLLALMSFTNTLSPTPVALIPLYSVAAYEPRDRAAFGLAFFIVVVIVGTSAGHAGAGSLLFGLAIGGSAWVAGRAMRTRRQLVTALQQTAEQIVEERRHREAVGVLAERTRVGRELQLLVAEALSSMVMYAQTGLRQLERQDPHADETMAEIEDLGRHALQQMRALVKVLRVDGAAELTPTPGLGELYEHIDTLRARGEHVQLRVEGEIAPLPALVDACVYRIVAELLEHTAREVCQPPRDLSILLRFIGKHLEIDVATRGTEPASDMLAAIDQRIQACHGHSIASPPDNDGTHQLRISLPLNLVGALA